MDNYFNSTAFLYFIVAKYNIYDELIIGLGVVER